jgi:hypothetical protein
MLQSVTVIICGYSVEGMNLKQQKCEKIQVFGHDAVSICVQLRVLFTNRNGVTTPKTLLPVITGMKITNLSQIY